MINTIKKLFNSNNKSQVETITTILNGHKAKGRQDILENLSTFHDPLDVYFDLKGGNLIFSVGKSSTKIAGTIDSKIVRKIEEKYTSQKGLSCDLEIGQNYTISKDKENNFVCNVKMSIKPK